MRRRTLVQWAVAMVGALPFGRARLWASSAALPAESQTTLRALAAAVLPESLGAVRTDEIADGFVRWIRAYDPGVEMDHGYGAPRLRWTPPSAASAYEVQLARLEGAARERGGSFAELPPEAKRDLVSAALQAAKVRALPPRPDGRHVASDLMSFYFRSSEANDLCYRAEIGRDTCRGLPDSEERPSTWAEERRG